MWQLLREDSRRGRCAVAALIYCVVSAVYLLCADPGRLSEHTPYNHFALLADGWLHGHLDLPGGPPRYSGYNDFAKLDGHWFIVFPAFPAALLLPLAAIAGEAERVRDGQFFVWCAGLAPAVLFLALEQMRALGFTDRKRWENVCLAVLFAVGTVYFFSAVQGTVWFAAHVVGAALAACYLLFSLGAARPLLAGLAIGLAVHTRTPLLFAVPLFALEALRVSLREPRQGASFWARIDAKRLLRSYAWFAAPIVVCLFVSFAYNQARFGSPFEVGYQYLQVNWQGRIQKWGLFSFHYLPKNLGVVLTSLPWPNPGDGVPFKVNAHGLALWFTTPLYLWLVWPKRTGALHWALWATVVAVAVPTLFYQNTGWAQFGYRFSNDYAVFLFALLALGGRRLGRFFWIAAVWAVGWNLFGALSFERKAGRKYYHYDLSQKILYQPD